jgi:hypothetical protein
VATVGTDGVVGGTHTVTAAEADSSLSGAGFPAVALGASPSRVLVAYEGPNALRLVLLDPASLSSVAGPVDLPSSFQAAPLSIAYSGGKFFVARTTRGTFDISAVDAATLKELRVAHIPLSADGLLSPRLVAVGSGVFVAFSRSATRLSFGWAPSSFDATAPEVFPLTDVDLGAKATAAGIAPLDDKHVAAAWADGNVEAAVITCGN